MSTGKPIIFISYAHADEPDKLGEGEVKWLSFVQSFLQPAVKHGVFDTWVDRQMNGGAKWDTKIEEYLRGCDIFVLLVSRHSMASNYIIDKEIAIIRERLANDENVYFYPLLLTPTPKAGLDKVTDMNLRPRDAKPFSSFPYNDRLQHMSEAANEIAEIAQQIIERKSPSRSTPPSVQPAYVHTAHLPETAYERLVGRDAELGRLDDAWADSRTNILSLIAEGGAGKSALVNEWLGRLQAENYRGAEAVLGWSFYSQGTKERATSADAFLDWALDKLGVKPATTSATAKGDAVAEAMMRRRVLLVLDGVEPLQHGPGPQLGQLKDQGLRALLRRFAATPLAQAHGLIVLTSRLAVTDIARWRDSAAPVVDVEKLSNEAGAALLRDNSVWGTDRELKAAAHDFGGHPLALGLLASFLKETQTGDLRRRDHIRALIADSDNPRHDHAKRVMESYEKEWLAGQPVLLAIMQLIGLFERPASGDCLAALRAEPVIEGLNEPIVGIDDDKWRRAVARLREVRLLAPPDPAAPNALDAHPLVREWFGERLRGTNEAAWKAAHGRLYEHLRDTTREGDEPTLTDLAPLYQAIAHGCSAGRHQEALNYVYKQRICRWIYIVGSLDSVLEFYSRHRLGASGSDLAAISFFLESLYTKAVKTLDAIDQWFVIGEAAYCLEAQGRLSESLEARRASGSGILEFPVDAVTDEILLGEIELLTGDIPAAIASANRAVAASGYRAINHAGISDRYRMIGASTTLADALLAAGDFREASSLFADAEKRQRQIQSEDRRIYHQGVSHRCALLLDKRQWVSACERAHAAFDVSAYDKFPHHIAEDVLNLARAELGAALAGAEAQRRALCFLSFGDQTWRGTNGSVQRCFDESVAALRASAINANLVGALLARAALLRCIGDWPGAARDLDEVEEIAEPGPMRLFLCDMALERARLAFARIEAFAPLNGLIDDGPPKPVLPDAAEAERLKEEARTNLGIARKLITECGYHRRDEELAELEAVLAGQRRFAELPPRV
ncbi:toll/interleukin-1 receptor domain-containing protein [Methylocapsa sp. S129]|uniref:toll/interleukin-1 receptor domain-containing protein n=1 Tax=Methylocapsa sp. S129 TaxID=1641869 RepID=UPI00131A853B|nr:toll/interleukin-1 receptor domain-containing protein [Methylocapsa sp. S129]